MNTLDKYWQKRRNEDNILDEFDYVISSVFNGEGTFDEQFEQFEGIYEEVASTFIKEIEPIVNEQPFLKSNWKSIKAKEPKLAYTLLHDIPILCLNNSLIAKSLIKRLGLEKFHDNYAINLIDLKEPLKRFFGANKFLNKFEKSMAFHRAYQIVYYNYMFGMMDYVGEAKDYNGSDALSKDIVLRQEIEKVKKLVTNQKVKKSFPLFNMEWETEKSSYEMAVSIGKSMYYRNSKQGFVLKPISCYFYHLFLKHKGETTSERAYCRSLFDLFHVVYSWKNLIMVYDYKNLKIDKANTKFIELMSDINQPRKKSDRNYGGKYKDYRYKVVQNIIKDDLAYHNPIIINGFATWRVMIDNNWDYDV